MPSSEAHIATDRPSRYLIQFCKHADAIGGPKGHRLRMHSENAAAFGQLTVRAEWSDTLGVVSMRPWGQCRLQAGPSTLSVRIDARDDDTLRRIEQLITNDMDRFSAHRLTLTWQPVETPKEPA